MKLTDTWKDLKESLTADVDIKVSKAPKFAIEFLKGYLSRVVTILVIVVMLIIAGSWWWYGDLRLFSVYDSDSLGRFGRFIILLLFVALPALYGWKRALRETRTKINKVIRD